MATALWLLILGGQRPAPLRSVAWALSYEGKATNEFIWDSRARRLINTTVPAMLADAVLQGLAGPPNPVFVSDGRYVSVSACVPHFCPIKAFFWIDTRTGVGLGAAYTGVDGSGLRLASNAFARGRIPAAAKRALMEWMIDQSLAPQTVTFFDRNDVALALEPDDFQPDVFIPRLGGPAFDCAQSTTAIEHLICSDGSLSHDDLAVASLVNEIRRGCSTVGERNQLMESQRQWMARRDARCAAASDARECLEDEYRDQYKRLSNGLPQP